LEDFMINRHRARPAIVLLALCASVAGVASCDATALTNLYGGGNGDSGSLTVYGSTTSASSGAVSAAIAIVAEDSACSGTTYGSSTGSSGSDGTYAISVSATSSAAGCVIVSGLVAGNPNPVTVSVPAVSFAGSDSVQVNLSFP
jgi:hypothetical protein